MQSESERLRAGLAGLGLGALLYRRLIVWRIRRLTKSARRKTDEIERLWASIGMEMPR